ALKDGESNGEALLWTRKDFGDVEFIVDCRPPKPTAGREPIIPKIQLRGMQNKDGEVTLEGATPGSFQRFIITLKNRTVTVKRNDKEAQRFTLPVNSPHRGPL